MDTKSLMIFFALAVNLKGEILFQESFEDNNFSQRGWYDGARGTISSAEHIPGSTHSFQCEYLQGQQGCSGGTPSRKQFSGTEIIYISYWVKYSANWVGSNRPYHPHEFYLTTNKDSIYVGPARTRLTVYIEQVGGVPRIAMQDSLNVDQNCILRNNNTFVGCNGNFETYQFTEARSASSCNGLTGFVQERDCYNTGSYWYSSRGWNAGAVYFSNSTGIYYKNDWHFIEAMFEMNSIQSGIGVPDGKIRYWYDGNLIISSNNILFRTNVNSDMVFNQLILGPYIGDGSPVTQTMWIDNLTLSTHRIGESQMPALPSPDNLRLM